MFSPRHIRCQSYKYMYRDRWIYSIRRHVGNTNSFISFYQSYTNKTQSFGSICSYIANPSMSAYVCNMYYPRNINDQHHFQLYRNHHIRKETYDKLIKYLITAIYRYIWQGEIGDTKLNETIFHICDLGFSRKFSWALNMLNSFPILDMAFCSSA